MPLPMGWKRKDEETMHAAEGSLGTPLKKGYESKGQARGFPVLVQRATSGVVRRS